MIGWLGALCTRPDGPTQEAYQENSESNLAAKMEQTAGASPSSIEAVEVLLHTFLALDFLSTKEMWLLLRTRFRNGHFDLNQLFEISSREEVALRRLCGVVRQAQGRWRHTIDDITETHPKALPDEFWIHAKNDKTVTAGNKKINGLKNFAHLVRPATVQIVDNNQQRSLRTVSPCYVSKL